MSQLELHLFGSPRLEQDGRPIDISLRKALALLAYLVVTGQDHGRDALAALFWPDDDQRKARGNLRRALSRLNKALGADILETDRERAGINPEAKLWLDVDQFRRVLSECQTHQHAPDDVCPDCLPLLAEVVTYYTADFLAGFTLPDSPDFDEWQFFEAEGLRQDLASALERLVRGYIALADHKSAIPYARRWLALDPLHEPAHRYLMELYAKSGQHAAAVRQFRECIQVLDEALGVSPAEETTDLYESIKTKRAPPSPYHVDEKSVQASDSVGTPHNLPPQPTSFIGREKELAEIALRLTDPRCRLLTLVGPGGIGKTRLALAAAERQLTRSAPGTSATAGSGPGFHHGVFFVPLAPLSMVEYIIPAIVQALGFRLESGAQTRSAKLQLLDYLRQKQLLLLLDNLEHLLEPASEGEGIGLAELVVEILWTAPEVKILATSRERLRLQEEHSHHIQGLEFPNWETAADVAQYSAAQLFLQSARRVRSEFELAADDVAALTRICHLVEGMPLGIELAASWVDVLSLADIGVEIRQNLDFLESELRNIPERHRSIRAVFDTSWQRLSQTDHDVFSRLSVFRGGFTRSAAQDVTGATLRQLATLANKSLLRYSKSRDRYEIHELLRQYGADKLAERTSEVRDRHCAYYCAALRQREADLKGIRQQEALAEIEADLDNARAAWEWAVAQRRIDNLDQATDCLGNFYLWRGPSQEGESAFRLVAEELNASPAKIEQIVLAKALAWQGIFGQSLGRTEAARRHLVQSQELLDSRSLTRHDTRSERAFVLMASGNLAYETGDRQYARRLLVQSLDLYRELDDGAGTANALQSLSTVVWSLGTYDEAQQVAEESLALRQELGDRRGVALSLDRLGLLFQHQGRFEESEQFLREAIAIHQDLGDLEGMASATGNLGSTYVATGEFELGRGLYRQTVKIFSELGHRHDGLAHYHTQIGRASLHLGGYEEAGPHVQAGLDLAREIGDQRNIAFALVMQAKISLVEQEYVQARQRLETAVKIYRLIEQQSELIWALGALSLAECGQDEIAKAQQNALEALQVAHVNQIDIMELVGDALVVTAFLLAYQGQRDQAIELYTTIFRDPYIANSRLMQDIIGQHLRITALSLPQAVAESSQKRRGSLDLRNTVAELLQALTGLGWGEPSILGID